jgi:hypothetical protein
MGHKFKDSDDEGIFNENPSEAAGDSDALADMQAEGWVPPLKLMLDADGLAIPEDSDVSILDEPPPVTTKNFICLAGPCKHYTENGRFEVSGPAPDADDHIEIGRWCGKVRTWAKPTDLSESEVFGCTGFEPIVNSLSNFNAVAGAKIQNALEITKMRKAAAKAKLNLGICAHGHCKEFVEILVRKPLDRDEPDKRESLRFCNRLAGLGRLYDLRERPVFFCNGFNPIGMSEQIAKIVLSNITLLKKYRKILAERKEEEQDLSLLDEELEE